MATDNSRIETGELKELAGFWSENGDALSLYFQVRTPKENAHRDDLAVARETIQQALGKLRSKSPSKSLVDQADVQRMLDIVATGNGNSGRAKVIFACGRRKLWREFDVAGDFDPHLDVGSAFTLAPLLAQQQGRRRYCIALADRNRARLLLLEARQISEHSQVLDEGNEKIRTTGARKSGHLERKKEKQAREHFAFLAEHLLHFHEHKDFDYLMVGCRDEMWPEIEAELHPQLKQILVGRFLVDPGLATAEEIRAKAQEIVDQKDGKDEAELVEKTAGAAAAKGLGAVGLREVIDALEKGEVRILLWPEGDLKSMHSASLCENCGHLEADDGAACGLCAGHMRRFAHADEALLRHTLGRGIEVRRLHRLKLPPPHEVAALLRYRVDMSTAHAMAS